MGGAGSQRLGGKDWLWSGVAFVTAGGIKWRKIASSLSSSVSHSPGVGFNGSGRVVRNRSLIPNCVPLESREGFYFRMFWATHEGSECLMNHQLMWGHSGWVSEEGHLISTNFLWMNNSYFPPRSSSSLACSLEQFLLTNRNPSASLFRVWPQQVDSGKDMKNGSFSTF